MRGRYLLAWLAASWCAAVSAAPTNGFAPRSMAYVLQADAFAKSRPEAVRRLAGCGRDLIVLDADFEAGGGGHWTRGDIAAIRAGRAGRRVVVYLSIGEAEDYRPYWKKEWDRNRDGRPDPGAPAFLEAENPEWKGNYRVRYWRPEWQALLLGQVRAALEAGFDGVYLDIVDAFETYEYDPQKKDWEENRRNPETGRSFREDMVAWVARVADEARRARPGALVIPQNGEALLADAAHLARIDAIGIEDLFTDGNKTQKQKAADERLRPLARLRAAGKPVLLIEYPTKPQPRAWAQQQARGYGFVLLLTDRELRTLGESP